jgi:NAD(P)-dependent dehydrogenase (short-subunit alcohol dehydrogenase family)
MLQGKVVVITGGAGLLGETFCRAVIQAGGSCVVADVDDRRASELAEQLNATSVGGGRACFCPCDINDGASLDHLLETLTQRFGHADALVNNAYPRNRHYGRKFEDVTREDFCDNVSRHLGGYFLASQKFIAFFRSQGHGNIVNMASVYGFVAPRFGIYRDTPMTMPVEYAVIKSGVLQLTRYLARYLAGENIRINAISPGGIADGQPRPFLEAYRSFCLNKGMLDPGDMSGALLFLLSDMSQFMNGQNLVIDDGFSL